MLLRCRWIDWLSKPSWSRLVRQGIPDSKMYRIEQYSATFSPSPQPHSDVLTAQSQACLLGSQSKYSEWDLLPNW